LSTLPKIPGKCCSIRHRKFAQTQAVFFAWTVKTPPEKELHVRILIYQLSMAYLVIAIRIKLYFALKKILCGEVRATSFSENLKWLSTLSTKVFYTL